MKKSRFTEQQIAFALQQAEGGTNVAEVQDGHLGGYVLSLEATVRRLDAVGGEEASSSRGGERTAA